jgi:hypothetical protein
MVSEETERETWTNPGRGTVYIFALDVTGKQVQKKILPGERISITPQERRMNQEVAVRTTLDFFTNGTLAPVTLAETAADYEMLRESPHVMSDSDIKELFSSSASAFKKRIAEISNLLLLERIAEVAQNEGIKATVAQNNAITARMDEVRPDPLEGRKFADHTDEKPIKPTYLH